MASKPKTHTQPPNREIKAILALPELPEKLTPAAIEKLKASFKAELTSTITEEFLVEHNLHIAIEEIEVPAFNR